MQCGKRIRFSQSLVDVQVTKLLPCREALQAVSSLGQGVGGGGATISLDVQAHNID